MSRTDWEVVIGLEIHVQLLTAAKIFSGASTQFGALPNSQASAVDLGLPGVLPVLNPAVYKKAVCFGLGIGAKINHRSVFDRKNYFYPDSPKGYQITQLDYPIIESGEIEITLSNGSNKTIGVTRAHLEEDAGKSLHENFLNQTGIDLNRAGTPLLEIVSEPDLRSSEEAVAYAKYIHHLVTYLSVSDGNMAEGSLRCDANVSLRKHGDSKLGTRTETKNVNSFRFLERAIEFEISRQMEILESGGRVTQETRLYDSERDETRPMRSKETATDYRYFPEPDLLPLYIDQNYIDSIRQQMPELPDQKNTRFIADYQLNTDDAGYLSANTELANYFESVVDTGGNARLAANWVRVELMAGLNRDNLPLSEAPVSATELGFLIARIQDQSISGKIAKTVFEALWRNEATSAQDFIKANNLSQVSDINALEPLISKVLEDNIKQVEQFRAGKTKLMGFFVGQIMKQTQGKANPKQLNEILLQKLNSN
ncbi:MAG: Asp-tRNA(Asn)/Glu-tRNA(Gln) amidotransferase subunit GatB [Pseudomonadales bacterium]|nr:Asp-tRNA(Asn)/Glu-tRNA(Gln) amidotransferase subunit GatB [Pseudomonadales bacterium]